MMADNAWWSKPYGWKEKEKQETCVPRLPLVTHCQMPEALCLDLISL